MKTKVHFISILVSIMGLFQMSLAVQAQDRQPKWTDTFFQKENDFSSTGANAFFILKPGYQLILEGKEGRANVHLSITVLHETQKIGDVETRIVEERESKNGEIVEVSRNFYAISRSNNSVFYFGEEVDIYKNGKIVAHEGAWQSGSHGAHWGLMMPGLPLLGSRYYQEIAPGVAMDRAEIVGLHAKVQTPAGVFENCLKIEETTPLEKGIREYKMYAPGIGLIQDANLRLVKYGYVNQK
ncbi:MAG: hypothetical protein D6814_09635 [Calditrichaeota bacterium]|nr:MAG: hypothetical protein D6814_09635 [Calditrichota bacterium]